MTVFGARAFKEVVKLKRGCQGGPQSNLTGVLIRRNLYTYRDTTQHEVNTEKTGEMEMGLDKEERERKGEEEQEDGGGEGGKTILLVSFVPC